MTKSIEEHAEEFLERYKDLDPVHHPIQWEYYLKVYYHQNVVDKQDKTEYNELIP